jgi:HK97 gp10 family phage protein
MNEGSVELESHIDAVAHTISRTAEERLREAVSEVFNATLSILSKSGSGKAYRIPGTGRFYTASTPGELPALRRGELRQSVSTAIVSDGDKITGYVGTDRAYGVMLEKGTGKMAPQPWLEPAFREAREIVVNILGERWFD